MSKKHFIALVPMAGQHEGKIGQHSTMQDDKEGAIAWAKGRFNREFAIVEITDGRGSLETDEANAVWNDTEHYSPNT
jgi:hypothetical protein